MSKKPFSISEKLEDLEIRLRDLRTIWLFFNHLRQREDIKERSEIRLFSLHMLIEGMESDIGGALNDPMSDEPPF